MVNNPIYKKIKIIVEILLAASSVLTILFAASFALGFLIWSIYLQRIGFLPDEFFEIHFVLTGIFSLPAFIIFFLLLVGIFLLVTKLLKYFVQSDKIYKHIVFFLGGVFSVFAIQILLKILVFYSINIFPFYPAEFGGAYPRSLSILASEEEINYLSNVGILKAEGSKIQTENLCILSEDDNSLVLGLKDRVLRIKKVNIKGFGSLPSSDQQNHKRFCAELVQAILNSAR